MDRAETGSDGRQGSPWESTAARSALPVMGVAALVALLAAGVGLLLPGAELSDGAMQGVRVGGVVLAVLGVAALILHRRRSGPGTPAGVTFVALGVAALVMGLLALLALPYSDVKTTLGHEERTPGSGPAGSTDVTITSPTSPPRSGGQSTSPSAGVPGGVLIDDLLFTVGINPATGEPAPVAVDAASGRAVAIDPETGELTPMSLDAPGRAGPGGGSGTGSGTEPGSGTGTGSDTGSGTGAGTESSSGSDTGSGTGAGPGTGGFSLPVGVDSRTGEAGVIGVTDPETGEVGIVYETDVEDVTASESDGAIHVLDDVGDIVPLDAERLAEIEGDIPSIDFGELDYDSFSLDEAPGDWGGSGLELSEVFEDFEFSDSVGSLDLGGLGWDDIDWDDVETSPSEGDEADSDDPSSDAESESAESQDEDDKDDEDDEDDEDDDEGFFDRLGSLFNSQVLLALLLGGALIAAVLYALRMLGRSGDELDPPEDPESETPVAAVDAEAGLAASLAEAEDSGDPRQRIMAAYMRLLEALAAAGAPRQLQEAPHEHLSRVLDPLGVRPGPVHDLAELFVLARFSDEPVTEDHRVAAVTALETTLADLRSAARAQEGAGPGSLAEAPETLVVGPS